MVSATHRPSVLPPKTTAASQPARPLGHRAPSLRRRSVLTTLGTLSSAAALGFAAAGLGLVGAARAMSTPDVGLLTRRGMAKFVRGDVEGSLEDFDSVLASAPQQRPYLWQRGLSLYYVERYADGAQQFRDDVAVNPNDTEESIWALLCEARLEGFDAAQAKMLRVGRDSRPVMRAAYELFQGVGTLEQLRAAAAGGPHDAFYGALYEALYAEAKGDAAAARTAILAAVATPYAQGSSDYMAALARVHAQRRGWLAA